MSLEKYQGAIRNSGSTQQITFGVGSDYLWDEAPAGLGIPSPEYSDNNLPGDGVFAGYDRLRKRIIRIPIILVADNQIEVRLHALKSGFRPSTQTKELDIRLEGAARRYYGRARGMEVDMTNIKQGVIVASATFETIDPYGYSLTTQTVNSSGNQIIIPNLGTAPSKRCRLTITGNGGKPYLENRRDPFLGFVRFRTNLNAGVQRRVNLSNFSVSTVGGNPRENELSIQTSFFLIEPHPNGNQIVFSGCQSVSAVVRYAYL